MLRSRDLLAVAAAAAVFCAIAYRSFLYSPGTPNFAHDWAWSPAAAQIVDMFHSRTSFSRLDSLGGPNTDVAAYPALFLAALPVGLIGSSAALKFFLLWTTIAAAVGAAALARACGADRVSGLLIGVAYIAGPYAFNKIVSGQVTVWLAYAALPFAFWAIRTMRDRNILFTVGAAALPLALVAPQLQILAASLVALIAAGFILAGLRGALAACAAGTLAAATQSPLALEVRDALGADVYGQFLARSPWELIQSPPLRLALRLDGYFTQSYALATIGLHHAAAIACYAFAAAAWLGLFVCPGLRRAGWIAAAGAASILAVVCCYHLPWRGVADNIFLNVPAATVFRELYDLIALLAVAYVIGAARATGITFGRLAVWGAAVLVIAVACLARYDAVLSASDLRPHVAAFDALAAMPGDDRIWPEPNGRFLKATANDAGGFDPFFGRAGAHPIVEEYFPTGPVAVARMLPLGCAGPLLRAMRVRYIWRRHDLMRTAEAVSPVGPLRSPKCADALHTTRVYASPTDSLEQIDAVPAARRAIDHVDIVPDDWLDGLSSLGGGHDFIFARDASTLGVRESEIEPPLDDRRFVNPHDGPVSASLFGGAGVAFVELAGGAGIVAAPALAHTRINPAARFVYDPRSARFALALCEESFACVGNGGFALFGPALRDPTVQARALSLGSERMLVVDTQFDPALHARARGRDLVHVRIDGYANGWLVPAGDEGEVAISDGRTAGLIVAWIVAIVAWLCIAGALAGGALRSRAAA
jgi:hypothetical protein